MTLIPRDIRCPDVYLAPLRVQTTMPLLREDVERIRGRGRGGNSVRGERVECKEELGREDCVEAGSRRR